MGALDDGYSLSEDSIHQLRDDHNLLSSMVRSAGGRRTVLYPPQTQAGSGVGGKIWFKVISISDYYWEVPGCEYIRAQVTQKSCNANVAIGDIVYIFDPFFCWFNLPIAIMMRITGTATFAENAFWDGVTPLVCGVTPGKCFWSVDSVCCLEEDYGAFL